MEYIFQPTHGYMEIARGVFTSFYHTETSNEELIEDHGSNFLPNVIFSMMSITVLYSYMTIESFVNYQLYRIWEKRHNGSQEAQRLLKVVGDVDKFENLKNNNKFRELGDRIKTLCDVFGFEKPHNKIPKVWQDFKDLSEISRHFFIHLYPGGPHFQNNAQRIFERTESGKYFRVAEDLLRFFYKESGRQPPEWVSKNTLIKFRGIDLLVGDEDHEIEE